MKSYKTTHQISDPFRHFLPEFHELGWELFETRKKGISDDGSYSEEVEFYVGHKDEKANVPDAYLKALEAVASPYRSL